MTDDQHAGKKPTEDEAARRGRLEEALRESEKKYRALFYQAADGILAISTDGKVFIVNDSFARMHGYGNPEEMEQLNLSDLDTPETARLAPERLHRILNGETLTFEVEHYHKDGHSFPLSVICNIVKVDGKPYFLGFHRDITVQKRAEAALTRVQKLESLGLLAGGIAHDFSNILSTVVGSLSLLKSEPKRKAEDLELITEADAACRTAIQLARRLLTFASEESPDFKVTDLRPLLEQAATFAARGSNARCVFDFGELPLAVKVDRDQVVQVVQNLVLNATQAMPKGGEILVQTSAVTLGANERPPLAAGSYVQVRVKDQGAGIPQEHLQKIFDPYFSTKGASRGLGLAVCHSILIKHGGLISAESRPGEGTVMSLYFPAVSAAEIAAESAAPSLVTGSGSILIMDDNAAFARIFKRMLNQLGYQADSVEDGQSALESYRQAMNAGKPYDVVIMDLVIPGGMGGKETAARMKKLDPEVKAVISSGYSDNPVLVDYAANGFCGVLIKPYRLEEVSQTLRRLIGEKRK